MGEQPEKSIAKHVNSKLEIFKVLVGMFFPDLLFIISYYFYFFESY
jgi:hypothetical protein